MTLESLSEALNENASLDVFWLDHRLRLNGTVIPREDPRYAPVDSWLRRFEAGTGVGVLDFSATVPVGARCVLDLGRLGTLLACLQAEIVLNRPVWLGNTRIESVTTVTFPSNGAGGAGRPTASSVVCSNNRWGDHRSEDERWPAMVDAMNSAAVAAIDDQRSWFGACGLGTMRLFVRARYPLSEWHRDRAREQRRRAAEMLEDKPVR
ncbi:hypothetical protein JHL17_13380 [Azospirillum sp. YIM B02556]|uniref:Uncharacterized protein n=1 Tax=Azospirillum endophyticum TaxID=2800326 RepID=A0ABS1F4R4_9PROT|nr:hypothetical protein [Azospirillum endophyticum]MBK1838406.1 hypothetical protein [Azospirillum endophyticum]